MPACLPACLRVYMCVCVSIPTFQQAGLLLDELPNCGAGAFQEFVDALDASKTPTHHQLSKKLQGMAKSS